MVCKYKDVCKHYQDNSITCTKEPGKYCGIFRSFGGNRL